MFVYSNDKGFVYVKDKDFVSELVDLCLAVVPDEYLSDNGKAAKDIVRRSLVDKTLEPGFKVSSNVSCFDCSSYGFCHNKATSATSVCGSFVARVGSANGLP